jgi:hypothetical protein
MMKLRPQNITKNYRGYHYHDRGVYLKIFGALETYLQTKTTWNFRVDLSHNIEIPMPVQQQVPTALTFK